MGSNIHNVLQKPNKYPISYFRIFSFIQILREINFGESTALLTHLQGVQDQKCQKEMAISLDLEGNTFDQTLVKPKCV